MKTETAKKSSITLGVVPLLAMLAGVIHASGILRDGLTTWMPTFFADMFGFSTATSILTGIVLPIFSVICYNVASLIDRWLKNEIKSASVIFCAGAVAAGFLIFLRSRCTRRYYADGGDNRVHARSEPDADFARAGLF